MGILFSFLQQRRHRIAKDPAQNNVKNAAYYGVADIDPSVYVCTSSSTVGVFVCSSSGTTKSQAIKAFKQDCYVRSFYSEIEGLCECTKTNSPFQCTREKPIEATQRISSAYAGAMFVYTTLSILFPLFMRVRASRAEKLKRFIASKGIDIAQYVEEEEAVN